MSSKKKNKWKKRFLRLQAAVVDLYVSAMWKADREVENEAEKWERLRDAAGIAEGTKSQGLWLETSR